MAAFLSRQIDIGFSEKKIVLDWILVSGIKIIITVVKFVLTAIFAYFGRSAAVFKKKKRNGT